MRRRALYAVCVWMAAAIAGSGVVWASSAPVVSNVTASQRADGSKQVDIRYDLADADNDACTVSVVASNNAGTTWTVAANALTGAVGSAITPGTGKVIVWDCKADLPGVVGSQFKVRVCADDGHTVIPPGMALIPAGEFLMGNSFDSSEGKPDELPRHAVYVDAFYMDKYEVTNEQYAEALNWAENQGNLITVISGAVYKAGSSTSYPYCSTTSASTGTPNYGEHSRITWNGSTFGVVSGKEKNPMVTVSWFGSVAYANWRSGMSAPPRPLCYDLSTWNCNFSNGYRLPTEAEWEKAARGGAAGHRFPWSDSDTIQHARANYVSVSSPSLSYDTSPTRSYHPTFNTGVYPYTSPVGYFAANGYGLYDMAGNVWEWCNDWYDGSYYSSSPTNNPRGPTSGMYRVLHGGSWYVGAGLCRVASRGSPYPIARGSNYGFRLALHSE